jgi:hypothetical protein
MAFSFVAVDFRWSHPDDERVGPKSTGERIFFNFLGRAFVAAVVIADARRWASGRSASMMRA